MSILRSLAGHRSRISRTLAGLSLVPFLAAGAASAAQPSGAPESVVVLVDQAKVVRLPEKAQTVIVGNPAIADVAVQRNGVMVVTGKSFGVTNLIELTETPSAPDIRKQIEDTLKRSAEAEATSLQIEVDGDKVILNGYVKAWSERGLIARAAWSAPGVRIVEDNLVVR